MTFCKMWKAIRTFILKRWTMLSFKRSAIGTKTRINGRQCTMLFRQAWSISLHWHHKRISRLMKENLVNTLIGMEIREEENWRDKAHPLSTPSQLQQLRSPQSSKKLWPKILRSYQKSGKTSPVWHHSITITKNGGWVPFTKCNHTKVPAKMFNIKVRTLLTSTLRLLLLKIFIIGLALLIVMMHKIIPKDVYKETEAKKSIIYIVIIVKAS